MTAKNHRTLRDTADDASPEGQKKGPRRGDLSKGLLLSLASVLLFLGVLEIAVRILEPREVMRYFFMSPDPVLSHVFIPNATGRYVTTEFDVEYKINSLGLRCKEFELSKPPDTYRILMLGDSFTEGDGVEETETFSHQLQGILDSSVTGRRCQIINAGVGSYSSLLEYLYLTTRGLALQPDLVILNFDLSDVFDDINYTRLARFNSQGVPIAVAPFPEYRAETALGQVLVSIKDFFKDHTRLYNFIRIRVDRYLEGARHEYTNLGDVRYDKYAMLRESVYPPDDSQWGLSYRYLSLIRDTLAARGVGFWMTVYPYGLQISPKEWHSGRQFWGFKRDTVYTTEPQALLQRFGATHGIKVINLCDDFRAAASTTFPLYLEYNGHWRPSGHRVVANALARELRPYLNGTVAPGISYQGSDRELSLHSTGK